MWGEIEMSEQEMHTLRLIYADLIGKANLYRAKGERYMRGEPERSMVTRCKADTYASAAYVVAMYCRKAGFDVKGENHERIQQKSEDA
jgi:hypothetical protein